MSKQHAACSAAKQTSTSLCTSLRFRWVSAARVPGQRHGDRRCEGADSVNGSVAANCRTDVNHLPSSEHHKAGNSIPTHSSKCTRVKERGGWTPFYTQTHVRTHTRTRKLVHTHSRLHLLTRMHANKYSRSHWLARTQAQTAQSYSRTVVQ